MFCPKCGKETVKGGMCRDCFMEKNPLKIKEMALDVCNCGRYRYRGNWNPSIENFLKGMVRENIVLPEGVQVRDLKIIPEFGRNKIQLEILVDGTCQNKEFQEKIAAGVRTRHTICPQCSRISGGYYEAVLQFRGEIDPTKILSHEFVTKTEKVRGGFDVYVIASNYAKKISRDLIKKGFLVKDSAKLIGKRDGKDLHRLFISIKSPKFMVGDFLQYRDRILRVLGTGKSVRCKDIKKGKMVMMPMAQLQRAKLIAKSEHVRRAMVSSVAPNEIQLMDLESYKTFELPGKSGELRQQDEVEYLRVEREVYLV